MGRTLSDEDVQAIALKLVDVLAARLASPELRREEPSPQPPEPPRIIRPKLAYSLAELSRELGISKVSVYRLEARGLLKSLPYLRTKIYSHVEVEKFLRGQGGERLKSEG